MTRLMDSEARTPHDGRAVATKAQLSALTWAVTAALFGCLYQEITGGVTVAVIGTYHLNTSDITLWVSLISVCTVLRYGQVASKHFLLVISIIAVLSGSLLRGLFENPVNALMWLRNTGPLSAMLFISVTIGVPIQAQVRVLKLFALASFAFCLIVITRRIFGEGFLRLGAPPILGIDIRPLSATAAILVAMTSVTLLARALSSSGRLAVHLYVGAALTMGCVFISAQGTASICALLGASLVLGLERGPARTARLVAMTTALAFMLLLAPFTGTLLSADTWQGILPDSALDYLARRAGTNITRHAVWHGLMADFSSWSAVDKLFGLPAGTRPEIVTTLWGGTRWDRSLHSMYFQLVVDAGLAGATLYVLFLARGLLGGIQGMLRTSSKSAFPTTPALALFGMTAVFSYSYAVSAELSIILLLSALALRNVPTVARRRINQRTQSTRTGPIAGPSRA